MKRTPIYVKVAGCFSVLLSWTVTAETSGLLDDKTAASMDRSAKGLQQHTMPDGTVHMHLDGRFRHATVARVNDSGQIQMLCTGDVAQAEQFLLGETQSPEPKRTAPVLTPQIPKTLGEKR